MSVTKKYVLIKMETYRDKNDTFTVELNQGHESLCHRCCRDAHNKEFDTEEEAINYLNEKELYGDWLCVPMYRRNWLEDD
jgi:hypothetical protein